MQPYFFPHFGHFALIAATDRWVVFDITQYTPKTWMSRNRILHPVNGWQYVNVPLNAASMSIRTCEARVLDRIAAGDRVLRQISHYRKRAPYYSSVLGLIDDAFQNARDESLVALNVSALVSICTYLGLSFNYQICSEMDLDIPSEIGPGGWAPMIASRMGAGKYINPVGGKKLFDPTQFEAMGIALGFLEVELFEYATPGYTFEPGLSIIDVMMWNSPDRIRNALQSLSAVSWCVC
jgi:hypothetical protein